MNRKEIRVTLTLFDQEVNFVSEDSGLNQLQSSGLRITSSILYGNGSIAPTAQIRIYGLALENMLPLLRVQWNTMQALMNTVKLEAGEEGGQLSTVFEGNITFAYPDMGSAPNVALVIESQTAVVERLKSSEPESYESPVDAAVIIKNICERMGYAFENNGATKMLDKISLENSDLSRIQKLCADCDFDVYIEQRLIAIAPRGGSRDIKVPVITPQTGLIGYPVPDLRGVSFRCFYDPLVRFGGLIKIEQSVIDVCNGDWRIYGVEIMLDANTPGGNWFCEVNATYKDSNNVAIGRR